MDTQSKIRFNTQTIGVIRPISDFASEIKIDVTDTGAFCHTCVERRCPIAIADSGIPVELTIKSAMACTNIQPGKSCCIIHRRKFYCATRNHVILNSISNHEKKN